MRAISVSLFDIGFGDLFYQILKEHRKDYKQMNPIVSSRMSISKDTSSRPFPGQRFARIGGSTNTPNQQEISASGISLPPFS